MGAMKRLFVEESGQGLAEYGLILGLIALAVVVALTATGTGLKGIFEKIQGKVEGVPIT